MLEVAQNAHLSPRPTWICHSLSGTAHPALPRGVGRSGSCSGMGAAVPDVVIKVVPFLPLGHREGQFPGHGSDPTAGQVPQAGLSQCHTCQDRDTYTVSALQAQGAA